jgi:hypothetical protein
MKRGEEPVAERMYVELREAVKAFGEKRAPDFDRGRLVPTIAAHGGLERLDRDRA